MIEYDDIGQRNRPWDEYLVGTYLVPTYLGTRQVGTSELYKAH